MSGPHLIYACDGPLKSMDVDISRLYAQNEADRYEIHARHLNEQMVRVLRTIGYDVRF